MRRSFVDPLFLTLGDAFARGQVTECAVWTDSVAVLPPLLESLPRIGERTELVHVQTFVAQLAVEAFNEAVVRGFGGPREAQSHATPPCPVFQCPRYEFRAVIDGD